MQIEDYIQQSKRTEPRWHDKLEAIGRMRTEDIHDLEHAIQGMITEIGEFADVQKKYVQYGKHIDWVNMAEELGDLMWYVALAARVISSNTGMSFGTILQNNIDKLKARYPANFTESEAIHRDTDAERRILEGGACGCMNCSCDEEPFFED